MPGSGEKISIAKVGGLPQKDPRFADRTMYPEAQSPDNDQGAKNSSVRTKKRSPFLPSK